MQEIHARPVVEQPKDLKKRFILGRAVGRFGGLNLDEGGIVAIRASSAAICTGERIASATLARAALRGMPKYRADSS